MRTWVDFSSAVSHLVWTQESALNGFNWYRTYLFRKAEDSSNRS